MKALQIIETAYRATMEEQDDTILWLSQAMKNAGGDLDVLLGANAVNYALLGQDASGLQFGDWRQTQPPAIADDIARMMAKGISVFVVADDRAERGLAKAAIVEGVKAVPRAALPRLIDSYDRVWRW
jgi:sulfur relay (sulfurtransferase) DsrF/TusC family protein